MIEEHASAGQSAAGAISTFGSSLRRRAGRLNPFLWLGPSLVLIVGVVLYPVVELVRASLERFDSVGASHGFAGLDNFRTLFAEPDLHQVVINTVLWVGVIVTVAIVVSLALAQFLNKQFAGRRFVRWALIVPWAASLVMTSIVWRYIYDYYYGYLNRVFLDLGLIKQPVAWSEDPSTALWSLIAVGIILSIPFTTYVFLAGLQAIPGEVYEAARTDGAGAWHTYRHVTLPLLRPALVVAVVLNTIYVFNGFPVIWTIAGNVPGSQSDTTTTFMYKLAFQTNLNIGESAALSVLNLTFVLVVVLAYLRRVRWNDDDAVAEIGLGRRLLPVALQRRLVDVAVALGDRLRPWSPSRLAAPVAVRLTPVGESVAAIWTRARRVVLPIVGLLIALFFLAPYIVMFLSSLKSDTDLYSTPAHYLPRHWEWSNWEKAFHYAPLTSFFKVSLIVALGGTALVLAVALPAAYYTARARFRGRSAFLYLVLTTQMLAPVAIVVGIFREFVQLQMSNTLTALVLADAAFNLAFAIWIMNGYFATIPVELEEAAMLDGLNRFQALRKVILRLALPGVVTATIFTFISIWNEFVVALTLISSPNKEPLTVGVEAFLGLYKPEYQYLFVASLVAIVPVVVLFAAIERYLVSGLTAGSVK